MKQFFSPSRDQEFVIRLTPSGRILDCDERIKGLLELVPQEVVGTSLYDHLHRNDIPRIVEVPSFTFPFYPYLDQHNLTLTIRFNNILTFYDEE